MLYGIYNNKEGEKNESTAYYYNDHLENWSI
jgi:hypothetical protein